MCGQGDLSAFALDSLCVSLPERGRKISPNSALSHNEVWADAEGLVRCPRLTHHSIDHLLVPFSARADALLSQVQTSRTCIALCFPSVGISRVILKYEGWVMETPPTDSDSEWVLMSVLFWFQLTGPCLGEVPTVQNARQEVKQRKKQTDSGEEYRGRGRGRKGGGRGQGEHEPLQGLSCTSPKPAASDFFFFFFPHPLLLWPPSTPATVQSHRLNHSKLLFDGLNKPS